MLSKVQPVQAKHVVAAVAAGGAAKHRVCEKFVGVEGEKKKRKRERGVEARTRKRAQRGMLAIEKKKVLQL